MTPPILPSAFAPYEQPDFCSNLLVHVVRAGSGYLFVALKCVAAAEAASGADEIWVSTAYRLGPRSLTRQLRTHSFVEVEARA